MPLSVTKKSMDLTDNKEDLESIEQATNFSLTKVGHLIFTSLTVKYVKMCIFQKAFVNRDVVLPPLLFDESEPTCEHIYRDMTPHRTTTIVDSSLILVANNLPDKKGGPTDETHAGMGSVASSDDDVESQGSPKV